MSEFEKRYYAESFHKANLDDPKWDEPLKVHDWRNYVGDCVKSIWNTLSIETRAAIALDADKQADNEEWD